MFAILLIFIIITSYNVSAQSKNKTIYVAGDNSFPPYGFVDNNGEYKGFNVDIMKAIALESDLDIVFTPMPWKDALVALDNGKVQAIQGMTSSDARAKKYIFSDKILTSTEVIFVRQETKNIVDKNSLEGMTVSLQNGAIGEEFLKDISNIKIISKKNQKEALEALLNKDCDAFIGNKFTTKLILQNMKKLDDVKIVGVPIYTSNYSIVTLKDNTQLMGKINNGIRDIKNNKTYDKLYNKWFGERFIDKSSAIKKVVLFISITVFIFISIIIIILIINKKLNSIVKNKTSQLQIANEKLRIQYEQLIKKEERLQHIAYNDELTGLPNRAYFVNELNAALGSAIKTGGAGVVMFIDFDNFKNINDILGHEFGDEALRVASEKLKACIDKDDVICRFGGDEFLILKKTIKSNEEIEKYANGILNVFRKLLTVRDQQICVTTSIGISCFPMDGVDSNTLMKEADTAMYEAKESGKDLYKFFETSLYDKMLEKTELGKELRKAIDKDEFMVYYQPQVSTVNGKVLSLEALIRWNNPFRGLVSPLKFIPLAEETGIIVQIGDWVLKTACIQNVLWKQKGYDDICVSVNISEVQLRQKDFISKVKDVLRETGLDPKYLELEITESALMRSLEQNLNILMELKAMGIKIALDDFGTGYSSLNYLRALPIDNLKIDKSFINNICVNKDEESILDGIIFLAHKMELQVTVEGVETVQQLKLLTEKGCDKIQGYYFSKPYPVEKVEKYIESRNKTLRHVQKNNKSIC